MLSSIYLDGFKSFVDQTLPLGQLTVLTGLNNSGKSSVMQAMRMCLSVASDDGPYLPGYGGYSELKSRLTKPNHPITICVEKPDGRYKLVFEEGRYSIPEVTDLPTTQFLSADRFGPMVELAVMGENEEHIGVGQKGEFAAHFVSIIEEALVADSMQHPASESATLKHQLPAWMNEVAPGIKLEFHIQKRSDSSRVEVNGNRATNSGFGISYTLPVLLALLSMTTSAAPKNAEPHVQQWFKRLSENGGLLLIENPEAHLHPRGQTAIGKLLVAAAAFGLQVVVETHSDHLLDGIRLAMKAHEKIKEGDIRILYFTKSKEETTEVAEIQLSKNGRLSAWPEGFFDQMSKNLRELSSAPRIS